MTAIDEAERLIGVAESEFRYKDADTLRQTLLIPALKVALAQATAAARAEVARQAAMHTFRLIHEGEVEPQFDALEELIALNETGSLRHATNPRCHTLMPTDASCSCGLTELQRRLAAFAPAATEAERE